MGSGLLVTLAYALLAALAGALVALRLRQSAILGYIVAGVAIGPFTPGVVADIDVVGALADVGVVFLLFAIGAQLSFRDLLASGRVAIFGGSVQVLLAIGLGYLAGAALGWGAVEALFFGAVVSNSSSTVLSKVLGERGQLDAEHGRIALAWSTVQDLSTIVLVVLLSALAAGGERLAADLAVAVGKAVLFLALVIPLGLRLFPAFFERVAATRNREVFILAVAAVALGTAFAASLFGVSLALGAFVAGLVVGESDLSHQVVGEIVPLRDVLVGLFFVSVGMLIDPLFVAANLPQVLLVVTLMVPIKGVLVAGIAALFRYSARTALLTGVALAQCAEFSFLMARVGQEIGAVTPGVFSLMLAGAAASILLSPWLHALADPAVRRFERWLPESPLARAPALADADTPTRRHAVICGYDDVGRVVGEALTRRRFSFVVIDQDLRVVRHLREQGVPALLGSADNPVLLERVGLDRAQVLVVAIPDALATRQIVEYARRMHPKLDIVARTHSADELRYLRARGVEEAVAGEVEVALEITRHTLHRFGVSAAETLAIVQGLRLRAGATAAEGSMDRQPPLPGADR
jgi:CPA2 family monovalent cation:H+ antiporter-2